MQKKATEHLATQYNVVAWEDIKRDFDPHQTSPKKRSKKFGKGTLKITRRDVGNGTQGENEAAYISIADVSVNRSASQPNDVRLARVLEEARKQLGMDVSSTSAAIWCSRSEARRRWSWTRPTGTA